MRKLIVFVMMIAFGALIAGCSNDGPITLLDEQGKEVTFEKMDKPALVFFFTGVE
jgi:predicted small lipoprotein YifL